MALEFQENAYKNFSISTDNFSLLSQTEGILVISVISPLEVIFGRLV